jgi:murein DD-endopeptidase MepM/ murein hydrolase activator NlpD
MTGSTGLTAMMGNESTSASSGLGNSMGMIMLPMIFAMMEKLLQKQMELLQAGKLTANTSTNAESGSAQADAAVKVQTIQNRQAGSSAAGETIPGSHAIPHGQPVTGGWLSQGFTATHNGLDFAVVTGTEVHSSMDGKVTYAGWSPIGYGNLVIVQNGDYQTYYAHLSKIPVSVGQTIQAGSLIGLSGSTGNSTGPHLHYEARYKGKNLDPTSFTLKVPI